MTDASSSSSIVVDDGVAGGARDGVAAEGARVVAGLEARWRVVGDEQAADRQPVREAFASVTASGLTSSCSQAKNVPVRPTPVWISSKTSSAPCSSASARAVARNSGVAGWMPPSPWTGSSRIAAVSGADRGRERGDVVEAGEAHAGSQRLERGALRRLAGDRERARRPAVERVLERDDARLAGRLARVLERGLDRLGARVAEERLRAAEPVREALGERAIGSVQ